MKLKMVSGFKILFRSVQPLNYSSTATASVSTVVLLSLFSSGTVTCGTHIFSLKIIRLTSSWIWPLPHITRWTASSVGRQTPYCCRNPFCEAVYGAGSLLVPHIGLAGLCLNWGVR